MKNIKHYYNKRFVGVIRKDDCMNLRKIKLHYDMKDILCILTLILCYIFIMCILSHNGKYILGSNVDFSIQHYTILEYFRNLFYKTHDFLPDFTFYLGAGQNIYHLSYYGLLNPIITFSYLFPHINMLNYMIITMSVVVIGSCLLFYFYLKKNHYSRMICMLSSLMFLCSAPFILHSHKHIMLIDYFPFLILGFYGIDLFIEKKKSFLLIISIILMIFTSYYFSISGLVVLFILGIFRFYQRSEINYKSLLKFSVSLLYRFIIAVSISAILILPTFYTLLSERTNTNIHITDLWEPHMYMLYSYYTMGLTIICLITTIYMLFSKKKANVILSVILLLISIFPVFNYILNGFLYIDAKSLIPFIPLVLLNTSDCLMIWFNKLRKANRNLLIIYIACSSMFICLFSNYQEQLMTKNQLTRQLYMQSNKEDNIYRTHTSLLDKTYVNKVCCLDDYKSTIYSSTLNVNYQDTYTDIFNNPLSYRNKFMLSFYSSEDYQRVYSKIGGDYSINIYKNDYILPIGYATAKTINKNDFKQLRYPDNIINLLGQVVSDKQTNVEIKKAKRIDLNYEIVKIKNIKYINNDDEYFIFAGDDAHISLKVNNKLDDQLLFISFNILESDKDIAIRMSNVKNKVINENWKYRNHHNQFNYVLFDNDKQLDISFSKGLYKMTNIKVSILNFEQLKHINQDIDPFILDKQKTQGDTISGNINVKKNSYFIISLPYDKGFDIYVDHKKTAYEKSNFSFIGFPITKGKHVIEINYHAPYKNIALIISLTGVILFLMTICFERKYKK